MVRISTPVFEAERQQGRDPVWVGKPHDRQGIKCLRTVTFLPGCQERTARRVPGKRPDGGCRPAFPAGNDSAGWQ